MISASRLAATLLAFAIGDEDYGFALYSLRLLLIVALILGALSWLSSTLVASPSLIASH